MIFEFLYDLQSVITFMCNINLILCSTLTFGVCFDMKIYYQLNEICFNLIILGLCEHWTIILLQHQCLYENGDFANMSVWGIF